MSRRVVENSMAGLLIALVAVILYLFAGPLFTVVALGVLGIPLVIGLDRLFAILERRRDTMGITSD